MTRCSTSVGEAPGISTNTSIIGTMICGSSSRGSAMTAYRPSSSDADDDERRQLRMDERRRQPARQSPAVSHWRTSVSTIAHRNTIAHGRWRKNDPLASGHARKHLNPIVPRHTGVDDAHLRALIARDDEDRRELSSRDDRGRWDREDILGRAAKRARPNMPDRITGTRRQINLHEKAVAPRIDGARHL